MASVARALRPLRRALDETRNSAPKVPQEFQSAEELHACISNLELYYDTLAAQASSFKDFQKEYLQATWNTDADSKTAAEQSEADAQLITAVDKVLVKTKHEIRLLSAKTNAPVNADHVPTVAHQPSITKLPKLAFPVFSGNIQNWQSFWDRFQVTVDQNSSLSNVDKFTFLLGQLSGDAANAVAGFALTAANYSKAIDLLKNKYGNRDLIIDSHYVALSNLPPATSAKALSQVVDKIDTHLNALAALGEDVNHRQFFTLIRTKLPPSLIVQFEKDRLGSDGEWSVDTLRQHLRTHVQICDAAYHKYDSKPYDGFSGDSAKGFAPPKKFASQSRFPSTTSNLFCKDYKVNPKETEQRKGHQIPRFSSPRAPPVTSNIHKWKCPFCELSGHFADTCTKITSPVARKQILKDKQLCYNCLGEGHSIISCKRTKPCFHCKKKHHTSICPENKGEATSHTSEVCASAPVVPNCEASKTSNLLAADETSLLQTLTTQFLGADGQWIQAKGIMDNGSNRSYITQMLADKLGPQVEGRKPLCLNTFGSEQLNEMTTDICRVNIRQKNGSLAQLTVNIVPTITGELSQTIVQTAEIFKHVDSFQFADSLPATPDSFVVDFLIGADFMWDFITGKKITLPNGLHLIGSSLGWLLGGRIPEESTNGHHKQDFCTTMLSQSEVGDNTRKGPHHPPDKDLAFLWDLETVGIRDPPDNLEDELALQQFNDTIEYREDEQRYYVSWPWKSKEVQLSSNYHVALGRLKSLLRKHRDAPEIFLQYDKTLNDQLQKGILEKVTKDTESTSRKYYVPHQAVITPGKTTKLRIVYDASSKANKEFKSLNECLYRGPVFLDDVTALLLRFRMQPIALISDIEKAFLQVGLSESERDVTRLLWLRNPSSLTTEDNVQVLRHRRVPFGMISSPFLLSATIMHHLKKLGGPIAELILKNIYVDNIIIGAATAEEAKTVYTTTKSMFQKASMNVREWMTNSSEALLAIPETDRASGNIKVLGIPWDPKNDTLGLVNAKKVIDNPDLVTKRTVLHYVASFFDPLGLICPAIIPGKILLQKLWKRQCDWDTKLPEDLQQRWNTFVHETQHLETMVVSRFLGRADQVELHCFCDASQQAYGICIFVRSQCEDRFQAKLVFAKARTAPVRQTMTIPRLELLAVQIGVKSLNFVKSSIDVPVTRQVLWTDSQCVLHWLKSDKPLTVFVRNRIKVIKGFPEVEFRYVPTETNPADLASRGTSAQQLQENQLWWNGPSFLGHSTETMWPEATFDDNDNTPTQETQEQQTEIVAIAVPDPQTTTLAGIDPTKYSTLTRLLRVTAWVLRFLDHVSQREEHQGSLTSCEIAKATDRWIFCVQQNTYKDVLHALKQKRPHPLVKMLGLWLDNDGLIRCGGRLKNADLDADAIHPKLLPKTGSITRLIVDHTHRKLYHAGVAHTLAHIRREFWIPSGRSVVFKQIKSCLQCRRTDGGPYPVPSVPPLPAERVRPAAPFTATGLDYLGPLYTKHNGNQRKVWVCLFTCLTTRAIHLEMVDDMTAEQFLMCLRRFVARRGKPHTIWSDNGTQFKKVQKVISKSEKAIIVIDDGIASYLSNYRIQWKFIPERAPWMGGFYERLVRSVKQGLKKSLGRVLLTNTQLYTVLTEIEAVLNSRPLVYVGSLIADGQVLTPAHFLSLNPKTGISSPTLDDAADPDFIAQLSTGRNLLDFWKKGQRHLETFWTAWTNQYLLELRQHLHKGVKQPYRKSNLHPEIGHVVQIKGDGPRGTWIIGQITGLNESTDNQIRSAKIRTPSGKLLTRSIMHLYPIEEGSLTETAEQVKDSTLRLCPTSLESDNTGSNSIKNGRPPMRKAAQQAKIRIAQHASSSDADMSETELLTVSTSGSPKTATIPKLLSVMWSFILCFQLTSSLSGVQPLLCNAGMTKIILDLSSNKGCSFHDGKDETVHDAAVMIFKSNIAKYESEAWLCKKVETSLQTWTSFAKWNMFKRDKETKTLPVSEGECQEMIQSKRCLEGRLVGSDNFLETENTLVPEYTSGNAWDCCFWKRQSVTNCFLIKGKVFQTFQGSMESNLGNVANCHYSRKSCALSDMSTVIWKINSSSQCEFTHWKTSVGKLWKNRFLSSDQEIALTWTDNAIKKHTCLGSDATLTDQGVPIFFLTNVTHTRQKRNAEPSDETAVRLEALELRLDKFFKDNLNLAFNSVCKSMNELQEITLLLAHSQPTLVARYLLQDKTVMGLLRGKYLNVRSCLPVDNFTTVPMTPDCRDGIPLNYSVQGETYFGYLDPQTSIVYKSAAPTECSLVQEILIEDPGEKLWVYVARTGELKRFQGHIAIHPLFTMNLTGVADFKSVIHKPIHMYSIEELRAKASINDLFDSMNHQMKLIKEIQSEEHGSTPVSKDAQQLIRHINQYTPFGFLSDIGHKLLQIWIYCCCGVVTIVCIWNCMLKKLQGHIPQTQDFPLRKKRCAPEQNIEMSHIPVVMTTAALCED